MGTLQGSGIDLLDHVDQVRTAEFLKGVVDARGRVVADEVCHMFLYRGDMVELLYEFDGQFLLLSLILPSSRAWHPGYAQVRYLFPIGYNRLNRTGV